MSVVTEEMVEAAGKACGRYVLDDMRAALAVVAPIIAARERERCAAVVEVRGCHADPCCDDIACIAAAIRALGDAT